MDKQQEVDGSLKCGKCGAMFDTHEQLEQHEGFAHSEEAAESGSDVGMQSDEDGM